MPPFYKKERVCIVSVSASLSQSKWTEARLIHGGKTNQEQSADATAIAGLLKEMATYQLTVLTSAVLLASGTHHHQAKVGQVSK